MSKGRKLIILSLIILIIAGLLLLTRFVEYNSSISSAYDKLLTSRVPDGYSDCLRNGGEKNFSGPQGHYCGGIFLVISNLDNIKCWWNNGRKIVSASDDGSVYSCGISIYQSSLLFGQRYLFPKFLLALGLAVLLFGLIRVFSERSHLPHNSSPV